MTTSDALYPHQQFRYCPRCGSDRTGFKNPRMLRCDECNLDLYFNTATGVALIPFRPDGSLLLTIRAKDPGKGRLDLPGGFVDPGESMEEACIRELQEELGIQIQNLKYIASSPNLYAYKGIQYNVIDAFFTTNLSDDISLNLDPEEIAGVKKVHPEDLVLDELAFDSHKRVLGEYFKQKGISA